MGSQVVRDDNGTIVGTRPAPFNDLTPQEAIDQSEGDLAPGINRGGGGRGNQEEDAQRSPQTVQQLILAAVRSGEITASEGRRQLSAFIQERDGISAAQASTNAFNIINTAVPGAFASGDESPFTGSDPAIGGDIVSGGVGADDALGGFGGAVDPFSETGFTAGSFDDTTGTGRVTRTGDPISAPTIEDLFSQQETEPGGFRSAFDQFLSGNPFGELNARSNRVLQNQFDPSFASFQLQGNPDELFRDFLRTGGNISSSQGLSQLRGILGDQGRDVSTLRGRDRLLADRFASNDATFNTFNALSLQDISPAFRGSASRVNQNVFDRFQNTRPDESFGRFLVNRGGFF